MGSPRVVLAEGDDPRVRAACESLIDAGVTPILLGKAVGALPSDVDYRSMEQAANAPVRAVLSQVAQRRNWDEQRLAACLSDPLYVAAAMVRAGTADAAVGGATCSSSEVIRAALQVIGLQESASLLSSCFLMELSDASRLAFADCAVVPSPDADGLAEIAIGTSGTFATLTGTTPAVAMLSFSTHGSASHQDVDLVREATSLVHDRRSDLCIDGDLQFDAAFVDTVGRTKAPQSDVAGHANVFVFPNLAAGNIGYKIAQRIGGARAYGPILQGLRAPMNDLSRGCDAEDVVSVALISALQASAAAQLVPAESHQSA
ncbi:phosphotransacetylase [Leekyejoonella antrihumi]|uniref:Phosphotransacetylase n=2 Tax=Leekyejoonella antrihumi TaxID=1660198 RepID=A0A563E0N8_9MICO|nr:phosphotransacetylase [Leekyejoonella antrihumi]